MIGMADYHIQIKKNVRTLVYTVLEGRVEEARISCSWSCSLQDTYMKHDIQITLGKIRVSFILHDIYQEIIVLKNPTMQFKTMQT